MTYRKSKYSDKTMEDQISGAPSEKVKQFKNENVLFKIHSHDGEEQYQGSRFPAKFSINISNAAGSAGFKPDASSANSAYNSPRRSKSPANSHSNEFDNNPYDTAYNERCLREHQIEYERLAKQANSTVLQYEKYIEELESDIKRQNQQNKDLKRKHSKVQEQIKYISIEFAEKLKKNKQNTDSILRKLQNDNKRLRKQIMENNKRAKDNQQRIKQLEMVIVQKEQMIKKISKMNNDVYEKMMSNQQTASSSQIKSMEKWLKNMNKIFAKNHQQSNVNQKQIVNQNEAMLEMLKKYEEVQRLVSKLEKNREELQDQCKGLQRDNKEGSKIIQNLKKEIKFLERIIEQKEKIIDQKEKDAVISQKQTQSTFFKKSSQQNCKHYFGTELDGTVKVKMQILLLQKDKRISQLQAQIQDIRRQNIVLRSKLFKDQCSNKVHEGEKMIVRKELKHGNNFQNIGMINRSKSVENFYKKKDIRSQFFDTDQDQMAGSEYQDNNIKDMYQKMNKQYRNFSETLNKFMENTHSHPKSPCKQQIHHKNPIKKTKTDRHHYEDLNQSVTYPYKHSEIPYANNLRIQGLIQNETRNPISPREQVGLDRRIHRLKSDDAVYESKGNGPKSPRFNEHYKYEIVSGRKKRIIEHLRKNI